MRRRSKCRIFYSFRKSIYFAQKKLTQAYTRTCECFATSCFFSDDFISWEYCIIARMITKSIHIRTFVSTVRCPVSNVQCCDQLIKKAHFIIGKINWYKDYWITYQKSRNAWPYIKRLDCVGFLDFYLGNFFLMNKIGHKNWINIDTLRRVYCEAFPKST